MPRVCTVCTHGQRPEIDRMLVGGQLSFRNIAERFGTSTTALARHKKEHLPATLAQAKSAQEASDAIDVLTELQRCFERVNLLFDACDRWLRDADDPTQYDIGPRATELDVTYDEVVVDRNGKPRTVRRKRRLAELLRTIEGEGRSVVMIETKHADPRDLVLKTANRLQGQMELLAKLMGDLSEGDTLNLVVSPDWVRLRSQVLTTLQPFPEARMAVAERLMEIDGDEDHAAD